MFFLQYYMNYELTLLESIIAASREIARVEDVPVQ